MSTVGAVFVMLTFCAIGALVFQLLFASQWEAYAMRVKPKKKGEKGSSAEKPKEDPLLKLAQKVGEGLLQAIPKLADERTQVLLTQGNYRTKEHLAIFIGIKALMAGGIFTVFFFAAGGNLMKIAGSLLVSFLAWVIPNFFLATRVKKRQEQIISELPNVIDLMIVCAQAGLGLLSCIDKVAKETTGNCPVLSSELAQLMNDVKIFAKSAANSLADLAERCGVEEIQSMASSLIAAETKGSDISYPLRQQAEALRDKLKRKKEEEAAKVPVKMVPVIMFFIMPLILCPILGPAAITIMQSLGSVFGGG